MAELKNIIRIAKADYDTLVADGSIVKNGTTYTYSPTDTMYIVEDGLDDNYVVLGGGSGKLLSEFATTTQFNNLSSDISNETSARKQKDTELTTALSAKATNQRNITSGDLNTFVTPGFYASNGSNACTNKPSSVDAFGLIVVHSAYGSYYTQILLDGNVSDKSYIRHCNNGTWTSWSQMKFTDTTYSAATASSTGLMSAADKAKLDNLTIGGRNLYTGSSNVTRTCTYPTDNSFSDYYRGTTPIALLGTSYVMSFYAKSTVAGDIIHTYFYNPSNVTKWVASDGRTGTNNDGDISWTLTTEYKRYWAVLTIPAGTSTRSFIFARLYKGGGTGTVSIMREKVEEGTVPTDWSLAPEATVKNISISGKTVTVTKGDGSTSTQTTQDTTYTVATTSMSGLMSYTDKSRLNTLYSQYRGFTIPQGYGTVTNNPTPLWLHLLDFKIHYQAESLIIDLYWGDGYNAQVNQNEWWRIFIKRGYQSTDSATTTVGVTVHIFGGIKDANSTAKVICSAAGVGQLWLCCSSLYMTGKYRYLLNDDHSTPDITITHVCSFQKDAPSFDGYVEQDLKVSLMADTTDTVAAANKWATARTLSLTGSVTGSATIDGSGNVSLATTTNHTHSYLPLSGGTMTHSALITFADSGSWTAGTGASGSTGGIRWTGQSDWAELYAEETGTDNLNLVLQFGDDNSNGLSIKNVSGTQTAYIKSNGVITCTGSNISSSNYGPLTIERTGCTYGAGIKFKNSNGLLGSLYLTGAANGQFRRFASDDATSYTILDTSSTSVNESTGNFTINSINPVSKMTQGDTIADNTDLLMSYKSGFSTSGYENRVYKKKASLLYDYVSSKISSSGSASKLTTARTVSGGVLDKWSFTFDGSGNVTASNDVYAATFYKNRLVYEYHRIASLENVTTNWQYYSMTLLIAAEAAPAAICNITFDTYNLSDESNTKVKANITWLIRPATIPVDFIKIGYELDKIDVYVYTNKGGNPIRFNVLNSQYSGSQRRTFTFYNINSNSAHYETLDAAGEAYRGQPYTYTAVGTDGCITGYANHFTNSRTLQVNLASTTAASFNGSANASIGVTGKLPVANGGTGLATLTSGYALIGNGTSAVSLRAISNNTSVGVCGVNSNLMTVNHLAYWNGAYSSTNSNLNYCKTGTIIGSNGGTMSGDLILNYTFSNKTSAGHIKFINTRTSDNSQGRADAALVVCDYEGNGMWTIGHYGAGLTDQYIYMGYDTYDGTKNFRIAPDGTLYSGSNKILHAGNYSSYAVPKSGGTMSGALTVNALLTASSLSVSGQASVGSLKIGDATISWDSTSNALKVDKNFYSTGTVASGV